ncbi:hypothetical protein LOK49_LG11G01333 [Camellia lanceoleosa]|uniref:Uncharacterized protein n=1 Tax=Camellia lanceoleosa TaxID=1840588 RepID=A0ACC0G206_9ERIC|nr:hypothetical protein LOK49_LG11G01333 [Camellia lanceoleosa]
MCCGLRCCLGCGLGYGTRCCLGCAALAVACAAACVITGYGCALTLLSLPRLRLVFFASLAAAMLSDILAKAMVHLWRCFMPRRCQQAACPRRQRRV